MSYLIKDTLRINILINKRVVLNRKWNVNLMRISRTEESR